MTPKILWRKSFGRELKRLPEKVQREIRASISRFCESPQNPPPDLKDKPLKNAPRSLSNKLGSIRAFRVGYHYRVVYAKKGDNITILAVKHRDHIYEDIKKLK